MVKNVRPPIFRGHPQLTPWSSLTPEFPNARPAPAQYNQLRTSASSWELESESDQLGVVTYKQSDVVAGVRAGVGEAATFRDLAW